MKKIFLGGLLATLINYCIGATYLLYKGSDKRVRANRTNANTTD